MLQDIIDEGSLWFYSYLGFAVIPVVLYLTFPGSMPYKGFPTAGIDENDGFNKIDQARKRWAEQAASILGDASKKFTGCFQVVTTTGPKIVLRGRYAEEIRNDPHLNFRKTIDSDFFGSYPGFEVFSDSGAVNDIMTEMVRGRLTQSLNFITEDLAQETAKTLNSICGHPAEWTKIKYKPMLLQLISRISTRVFVGPELCDNQEWLDVSVNYVIQAFTAAHVLHSWHFLLRPFVHYFLPECRELRRVLARARAILKPVIAKRRAENMDSVLQGEKLSKTANTIGWLDEVAKGREFDIAVTQLGLSLAAIHTTSELVSGIVSDICMHPEWLDPLREDIVSAIKANGWSKKALQDMKLVDSLMKESQRHHFGDVAAMHRYATEKITLSDGVQIPKGSYTMVSIERMNDTSIFDNPDQFDPERFMKMRKKPGQENKWHFVTTSPEHLAFGHGKHSCPGRFFAANEVKVVLAYLLVGFDWKVGEGGLQADIFTGVEFKADPDAEVLIKTRSQDILI